MAKSGSNVTQVYVSFIEVLFGVVVGISFAQFVPITLESKTFTALLAYATVVASWVGYHKALRNGSDDYIGPYRFVIDIILLYLYYYLINSFNDFPLMLVIFPIIFGFYVLWELSRLIEKWWKCKKNEPKNRIKWNIIFLILFLIQLAVYSYFPNLSGQVWFQRVFWIASMIMIIVYRINWVRDRIANIGSSTATDGSRTD